MYAVYDVVAMSLPGPLCSLRPGASPRPGDPGAAPSYAPDTTPSGPKNPPTEPPPYRPPPQDCYFSSNAVEVYAPTTMPPGASCLEVTQIYTRDNPIIDNTGQYFGVWDWCLGTPGNGRPAGKNRWITYIPSDGASFRSNYVRSYLGRQTYAVTITRLEGTPCWTASLYNYNTGRDDSMALSCGSSTSPNAEAGWSLWESYRLMNMPSRTACPTVPTIRATRISFIDPDVATFYYATPFTSYPADYSPLPTLAAPNGGSCWTTTSPYRFYSPAPDDGYPNSWKASTPY